MCPATSFNEAVKAADATASSLPREDAEANHLTQFHLQNQSSILEVSLQGGVSWAAASDFADFSEQSASIQRGRLCKLRIKQVLFESLANWKFFNLDAPWRIHRKLPSAIKLPLPGLYWRKFCRQLAFDITDTSALEVLVKIHLPQRARTGCMWAGAGVQLAELRKL